MEISKNYKFIVLTYSLIYCFIDLLFVCFLTRKAGQQMSPAKGQEVDLLDFVDHRVSVTPLNSALAA